VPVSQKTEGGGSYKSDAIRLVQMDLLPFFGLEVHSKDSFSTDYSTAEWRTCEFREDRDKTIMPKKREKEKS
jgi:hypothetical protein